MAYKRTYKKKRTYRKKKSSKPRVNFATRVKQVIAKSAEKKFKDTSYTTTIPNTAGGVVQCLTEIAQGDTSETRDGEFIQLISVNLKGFIKNHASATSGTWVRLFIVQDKRQVGDTDPAYNGATGVFTSVQPDSKLNEDNLGRFKILWMKTIVVNMNFSGQVKMIPLNYYHKFRTPLSVQYNGANSTDIQKNGIYLMACSDQATNTPTPDIAVRCRYADY